MHVPGDVPTFVERRNVASRNELLRRVRAEFEEMRCLRLTPGQARRLFGLRADVCERVLGTLVNEHTLTCGLDGRYGMRDAMSDRNGAGYPARAMEVARRGAGGPADQETVRQEPERRDPQTPTSKAS